MGTHPDTIATAVLLERELALRRTERRALLLAAATPPRSTRARPPTTALTVRWGGLARAIRSLRWVLGPARA